MEHLAPSENSGKILLIPFTDCYFHENAVLFQHSERFGKSANAVATGASSAVHGVEIIVRKR